MSFDAFDGCLYTELIKVLKEDINPAAGASVENKIEFVNLTPHAINVLDLSGKEQVFPASGQQARISMSSQDAESVNNFKVTKQITGDISGLPDAVPGKMYIVSAMIAQAAKRPDVVSPDTGPTAIRENGMIKAVKGFVTY